MPELPEVETFVRSLRSGGMTGESIINRQISSVDCFNPNTLVLDPSMTSANEALGGKTFLAADRRGKFIRLETDGPRVLIHLRMSGDLRCDFDDPAAQLAHDRLIFHFTDGYRLVFNDVRKFGRVWVTEDPDAVTKGLGIEPLGPELTGTWLQEKLAGQRRAIKAALLDQSMIAGIGNIYADESLFDAGILPMRPAGELNGAECQRLAASIRTILQRAIEANGSSFDWAYKGGHFQNNFMVYQRKGEPCRVCGTEIQRTVIGQRGTHYCPHCQH